jgi:hypothetical protein
MAPEATRDKRPSRWRFRGKKEASGPKTVEIELGGRKIQAPMQTVQTGAGSLSRFFRQLFS